MLHGINNVSNCCPGCGWFGVKASLWPVWNGWMAAALKQHGEIETAALLTQYIHEANSKNNDEFNECLHGKTFEPVGVKYCVWSAAGAILAELGLIC